MRRLWLCLPLCFVLIPAVRRMESLPQPTAPLQEVADRGGRLPDNEGMERLARTDPVAFLENCLRRYAREVNGYRATLLKHERIDGQLQRRETIDVLFRERPFSVLFDWREGARLARRTLYVKGQNKDRLLVLPAILPGLLGVIERDPLGPEARRSGRYPLTEFGMKIGMQRTLAGWEAARQRGSLHVEYLGERRVPELGGRPCWVLRRTRYPGTEAEGIAELTVYVDRENWLQVGSVLKGRQGEVIGAYFFRDVRLNPEYQADDFTRAALKR